MSRERQLLEAIDRKLDRLLLLAGDLRRKEEIMSQELDALTNQVKANTDAEQSAVVLLGQLSSLIKQAGTDPAKLQKLAADLDASKSALAAAIVENTPAAP
jgi:hypothetical protein